MMRCRGETYFARVPPGRNVDNPGCNPGGADVRGQTRAAHKTGKGLEQ